jgi:hypothetical protein
LFFAVVILLTFAVTFTTVNSLYTSDHPTSLLELDYAMWSNHSFVLGDAPSYKPNSVDVFLYHGRYYSALAPGTALLGLPFAAIGFVLDKGYKPFGDSLFLTETFVALCNSLAAGFIYLTVRKLFGLGPAVPVALAYAFASMSWPFATMYFQHDVSAMFVSIAIYFALSYAGVRDFRAKKSERTSLTLASLALGLAFAVDYTDGVLWPTFIAYAVWSTHKAGKPIRRMLPSLLTLLVGLSVILAYDKLNFGNPLVTSEQAYDGGNLISHFSTPLYFGVALNSVSPYRGIFIYSPVLLLGIWGLALKKRLENSLRFFFGISFVALFLLFSAWGSVDAGLSYGQRFLIPALPFLLIPVGGVLTSRRNWAIFFATYTIGTIENWIGAITSALGEYGTSLTYLPLQSFTNRLLHGSLNSWWAAYVGWAWPILAAGVLLSALVMPLILLRIQHFFEAS